MVDGREAAREARSEEMVTESERRLDQMGSVDWQHI